MARIRVLVALVATFLITTIGACAYYQLSIGDANPNTAIMREALCMPKGPWLAALLHVYPRGDDYHLIE